MYHANTTNMQLCRYDCAVSLYCTRGGGLLERIRYTEERRLCFIWSTASCSPLRNGGGESESGRGNR